MAELHFFKWLSSGMIINKINTLAPVLFCSSFQDVLLNFTLQVPLFCREVVVPFTEGGQPCPSKETISKPLFSSPQ